MGIKIRREREREKKNARCCQQRLDLYGKSSQILKNHSTQNDQKNVSNFQTQKTKRQNDRKTKINKNKNCCFITLR